MIELRAYLRTKEDRPNTVLIPPRTVREVRVVVKLGSLLTMQSIRVHGFEALLRRGVFPLTTLLTSDSVLLYNGSMESHYVKDEDVVAYLEQ